MLQVNLHSLGWTVLWLSCLPAAWAQQAGTCVSAPAGVMAWWPGDGDARDIAGTNNGVLMGGATANTPGLVGGAFSLDGVNAYVQLPVLVAGQAEGTIEGWFKLNSWNSGSGNNGRYQVLWSGTQYPPNYGVSWDGASLGTDPDFANTGGELMFGLESGDWHWALSGIVPQTNVWYHIAGTWGAGGINIYVNGILQGSDPYTGPMPGYLQYSLLGCSSWPGTATEAQIGEFTLYNRALSADEIAAIYAAGNAGKCKPDSTRVGPLFIVTTNGSLGFNHGQFRFTVEGPAGSNAVVQASTDLQTWAPLATNSLSLGSFTFTDVRATNYPVRYYRAKLSP
jgi:Concanavalin A-like lectin/glucanases superfamily